MSSQAPETATSRSDTPDADGPSATEGLVPGLAAGAGPASSPSGRSRRVWPLVAGGVTVAVLAAGGVLVGTGAVHVGRRTSPTAAHSVSRPAPTAPLPVAAVTDLGPDGVLPYTTPVALHVTGGTLQTVTGNGPDGLPVAGTVAPDGSWTSSTPLFPSSTYALVASVRDPLGALRQVPVQVSTSAPAKTFTASLSPSDGASVGVGQAISVRLSAPISDKAARAAFEKRLTVTTTPAVPGAWRWMSSTELRYRGADLWPAHTAISVSVPMDHVQSATGAWASGTLTSSFTVGDSRTTLVDTAAHTVTTSVNGQVVRVMKGSMGIPALPTRNGTFVVLEKFAHITMDSSTVALPPGTTPYKTPVDDAVRITNSGTFLHGAPWSVGSQGRANVSHGCINLSPVDAHWFYLQAVRGDVVQVVGSTQGPNLSDAGSQDWNMTFDQWKSGSALA